MLNSLTLPDEKQAPLALTDLAARINDEHHQAEAAMNVGLGHALEAGRLLGLAKKQCQLGTWLPWLRKNFKGSKRTAQAYLRLHREYPQLQRKAQRVALLSFRQALVNVANDTHIIYREEEPRRAEIIEVWQSEQCQNARRAAARAEVRRTTRTAAPKEFARREPDDDGGGLDGEDSTTKAARLMGVSVEMVEKAGMVLKSGDQELIAPVERGDIDLEQALKRIADGKAAQADELPPEKLAWQLGSIIKRTITSWRKTHPRVSPELIALVLREQADQLEKAAQADGEGTGKQ